MCLTGYLDDVVKGYDTLHSKDINHGVTKRDVNGLENKVVSFSTLGRYLVGKQIIYFMFSYKCQIC